MQVVDITTLVDDDDDFGQGEQLVRDQQRVEEVLEEFKRTRSLDSMQRLEALARSRDKNRSKMRAGGAIPIIISLLEGVLPPNLTNEQRGALNLLNAICMNLPAREEIRRLGGIDPLVKLLQVNQEQDIATLLNTFALLADNAKNRTTLQQRGMLEAAIPKMKNATPVIVQAALNLVSVMATGEKKAQDIIVKAGGVPDILAAVLSYDQETRRLGVKALGAVSSNGNRKVQALARKSKPAFNAVVKMLSDPNPENKKLAATVISYLADGDFTNQTTLEKAGVVEAIGMMIANPQEAEPTKEAACVALAALAKGNMKIQKSWGDFHSLIGCISSPATGTRVQSLNAIIELCTNNSANCDQFIALGIIPHLVNALQSDVDALQYRACSTVFALAHRSETRQVSLKRDPNLLSLLNALKGSGNPKVKQGAQWALEQL